MALCRSVLLWAIRPQDAAELVGQKDFPLPDTCQLPIIVFETGQLGMSRVGGQGSGNNFDAFFPQIACPKFGYEEGFAAIIRGNLMRRLVLGSVEGDAAQVVTVRVEGLG